MVWYFSSHHKMLFSLWRPDPDTGPQLYILASACGHHCGPLDWNNSNVEIDTTGRGPRPVRLFDVSAGFELTCGGVLLFYDAGISKHLDIIDLKEIPPPSSWTSFVDETARDMGDI